MAVLENPKPGIYHFVRSNSPSSNCFRRYDGQEWFNNAGTIGRAAVLQGQDLRQIEYWDKVKNASSVTLVANVDGSPLRAEHKQTQLRLL